MNTFAYSSDPFAVPNHMYTPTGGIWDAYATPSVSPDASTFVSHPGSWGRAPSHVETYSQELLDAYIQAEATYPCPPVCDTLDPMSCSSNGHLPSIHPTQPYSHNAYPIVDTHTATMSHGEPLFAAFRHLIPDPIPRCISPVLIHPLERSVYNPMPSDNGYVGLAPYSDPRPSSSPEPLPQPSPELIPSRRRNTPAPYTDPTPSADSMRTNRWQCPYCPYVQHSRRSPDLKRHIETHTRGARVALWVCCGVPTVKARELGVPVDVIRTAPIVDFEGVPMIGGCRKTFSRRDALTRHLRMGKGKCYGDPQSMHQPGNRLVVEES